jgi:hypothetical protein
MLLSVPHGQRIRQHLRRQPNVLVNTPPYSGGPGFKSRSGDRLSWLKFSWFSSVPQRKCWDSTFKSDWTTGRSRFDPRKGQEIFPLASVTRPALGSTQPPVQWVPGILFPGAKRGRGVTLTTHTHLVPRSWMSRSYTSSPPCASTGVLWYCFTSIFK